MLLVQKIKYSKKKKILDPNFCYRTCQCNQKCKQKELCNTDKDCGDDGKCTWQCVIGDVCNKLPGSSKR